MPSLIVLCRLGVNITRLMGHIDGMGSKNELADAAGTPAR
jgi:hypothetical protein